MAYVSHLDPDFEATVERRRERDSRRNPDRDADQPVSADDNVWGRA